MGQKVNPVGMRLQVNRTWDSRWYADTKDYGDLLLEDIKIREFIKEECKQAGVSRVIIERPHKKCRVTVHTARPGVIIGKKGADIETLRKKLAAMTDSELHLNIVEVRKPELDAQLEQESDRLAQVQAELETGRRCLVVTGGYWAFTLTDGALRMLVVLHFHSLGYSPPHGGTDEAYHTLQVKVKREGLRVRHFKGYHNKNWRQRLGEMTAATALYSIESNPLSVEVEPGEARREGKLYRVPITVSIPFQQIRLIHQDKFFNAQITVLVQVPPFAVAHIAMFGNGVGTGCGIGGAGTLQTSGKASS